MDIGEWLNGRAAVSKTAGCVFESRLPCQSPPILIGGFFVGFGLEQYARLPMLEGARKLFVEKLLLRKLLIHAHQPCHARRFVCAVHGHTVCVHYGAVVILMRFDKLWRHG